MTVQIDDVRLEGTPSRGRYVYAFADGAEAELTFSEHGPGVIALTHTYTPSAHRGQGIAAILVERAVADARRNGTRIEPACSFARDQFDLHADWADLRAR